jgi:putative nucleotidyltransferase with HDIG domain
MDHETEEIARALEVLSRRAQGSYLVGGWVRDRLLTMTSSLDTTRAEAVAGASASTAPLDGGAQCADLDVAMAENPGAVGMAAALELGGRLVVLDEERETYRIVLPSGRHIDICPLGESLEDNLRRRDFTINALAVPLAALSAERRHSQGKTRAAEIVDLFGGIRDLREGVVRHVSDDSFREDPARLLRAFRLCAQLGFRLAAQTEELIRAQVDLVEAVSAERLRDELFLMLACDCADQIELSWRLGLLPRLFPELAPLENLDQGSYHHLEALAHSIETVRELEELVRSLPSWAAGLASWVRARLGENLGGGRKRSSLLKLAALLHDIGKPHTRSEIRNSKSEIAEVHFYDHEIVGAEMVEKAALRLRLSRREAAKIKNVVRNHLRPIFLAKLKACPPKSPTRQSPDSAKAASGRRYGDGAFEERGRDEGRSTAEQERAMRRFLAAAGADAVEILLLSLADRRASRGPFSSAEEVAMQTQVTIELLHALRAGGQAPFPPRLVTGGEIMERYGLGSGPQVGKLISLVRAAQLEEGISTKEQAWELLDREMNRGKGESGPRKCASQDAAPGDSSGRSDVSS